MPAWLTIIIQILNLLGSSAMVGLAATTAAPPGTNPTYTGIIAGAGALISHLRENPFNQKQLEAKNLTPETK